RRYPLESNYACDWAADQFVACSDGQLRRRSSSFRGDESTDPVRVDDADRIYRAITDDWVRGRIVREHRDHVDRAQAEALESGPMVPSIAVSVGGRLQPRARYQRRTEGHGHHHCCAGSCGYDEELPGTVLGDHLLPLGDGRRDDGWWLADYQDDGPAHHQAHTLRRIRSGNRGRANAAGYRAFWDSCQHHAYHHWSHRRCRRLSSLNRRALGRHA